MKALMLVTMWSIILNTVMWAAEQAVLWLR